MDESSTQFIIICAVVIVPLVIYLMFSDSQSEKDEEEVRLMHQTNLLNHDEI